MKVTGLITVALLLVFADGSRASEHVSKDLEGRLHHPLQAGDRSGTVLIFYWHDCPVCNSYAPEINRIYSGHTNFNFYVVQVDRELGLEAAKQHAKEYQLKPPVLLDPKHQLVKAAKAMVTPEAVVFNKQGEIVYRGRIDDWYAAPGKRRAHATHFELRDVLDSLSEGKPVKVKETKAFGCVIEKAKL